MVQDKIIVKKYNEVFLKIEAERGILRELSDEFTFYANNYMFQPSFKNKLWDGKIRLLDLRTNLIYSGLLYKIVEFAKDRDYEIEIDPVLELTQDFPLVLAKKFIDMLDIHSEGKKINVREDQLDAFVTAIRNKRNLLISPTASGKSLIIYLLVQQMLYRKREAKGLIIVPRISLVEQLFTDFQDYASEIPFNVSKHFQRSTVDNLKTDERNIVISTYQTLKNLPAEYFEKFDFIIGDEAHLFSANELKKISESCVNAGYRFGLTGSLDDSKTNELVLEGLFGRKHVVITTRELMDKGHLSKLEIKCIVLKHPEQVCQRVMLEKDYKKEIEEIISSSARNRFIKNLALSLENNTMILFDRVEKHGMVLYDLIKNSSNLKNKKVFFVYGQTDVDSREEIRKLLNKYDDIIVIASYGTFSTGINTKNLHNLIFASPSKSRVRNIQSIGRSLRLFEGKEKATLFDLSDDFRLENGKSNTTLEHFVKRLRIYDSEKHTYKIYKVGLQDD